MQSGTPTGSLLRSLIRLQSRRYLTSAPQSIHRQPHQLSLHRNWREGNSSMANVRRTSSQKRKVEEESPSGPSEKKLTRSKSVTKQMSIVDSLSRTPSAVSSTKAPTDELEHHAAIETVTSSNGSLKRVQPSKATAPAGDSQPGAATDLQRNPTEAIESGEAPSTLSRRKSTKGGSTPKRKASTSASPKTKTPKLSREATTPNADDSSKKDCDADTTTEPQHKPNSPPDTATPKGGKKQQPSLKRQTTLARKPTLKSQGSSKSDLKRQNSTEWVRENAFDSVTKHDKSKFWKFISWNVNGLRAVARREGLFQEYLEREEPDLLCLQETKIDDEQISLFDTITPGYTQHWLCSQSKKGYSGVAVFAKVKPLNIQYGLGIPEHDDEGRLITLEFEHYYVLVAYVPNSGQKLERLQYRTKNWDRALEAHMKELEKSKPVFLTGDLNVAHKEIDIHNPAGNKKSAGYTVEERESFTELLDNGFVDTYRRMYPEKVEYSYWGYRFNARGSNKGWRLDYWLVSEGFEQNVEDSFIRTSVPGSDHCPVGVLVKKNIEPFAPPPKDAKSDAGAENN